MKAVGCALLALFAVTAVAAPWLVPHDPRTQHQGFALAPPMRMRLVDGAGGWHAPFVYPVTLTDRLNRVYSEDAGDAAPVASLRAGWLTSRAGTRVPWFPLGTDALGRDIASRLIVGSRLSLGVALAAVVGALLIGTLIGAIAGYAGGWIDEGLMRAAELVFVLPLLYVVLWFRTALPLVLAPATLFALLSLVLAIAGWPGVARGVRAVVARERQREYVEAARATGAGPARVLLRHVLPAAGPFLGTQALLLAPAFVLAESTLSYAGLGFNPPAASWGTMLQDAANVGGIVEFPWLLSPAGALVLLVLAINLAAGQDRN